MGVPGGIPPRTVQPAKLDALDFGDGHIHFAPAPACYSMRGANYLGAGWFIFFELKKPKRINPRLNRKNPPLLGVSS